MLRALGIQCRLVLSFVVSPLRPPAEELHSLSTKNDGDKLNIKKNKEKNLDTASNTKKPSSTKQVSEDKRQNSSKTINVPKVSDNKDHISNLQNKEKGKRTSKEPSENLSKEKILKSKNPTNTKNKQKVNSDLKIEKKTIERDKKSEQSSKRRETENHSNKTQQNSKRKNSANMKNENLKNKTKSEELIDDNEHNTHKPNLKKLATRKSTTNSNTSKSVAGKDEHKSKSNVAELQIPQVDGANDSDSEPKKRSQKLNLKKLTQEEKNSCSIKKHPKRLKKLPNYAGAESYDDITPKVPKKPDKAARQNKVNLQKLKQPHSNKNIFSPKNDVRNDIIAIMKGRMAEERSIHKTKLVKRKSHKDSDYDSDYAPEQVKRKHHDSDDEFYEKTKVKVKRRIPVKPEDNKDNSKKKKGVNIWVEVYLESEEKWISADISKGEVHCINQLYSRASHPVTYIVAWNNNNTVKDITQRYCPNWNTVTRKLRIDKKWWEASLRSLIGKKTIRDKEEDEELARLQLEQPLPKAISEYKDHPLYVLKRHLLKFQAIYPPDSITLGFVRDEPVYSRDCVHTLHSRETWLKHAKVVKLGETPYKIVKARPKYDRLSGQLISDKPLEVFGKWQIEDYVPPTAKDGIVPRNAYGNVELFKPCMLPKGTVHLQLPGLNKVAKKMNIDCVPAVVGFDIHSGWTHPTFDGFVVCEEVSESLIAAWYLEQEEREKRDLEKIEKRVYDNWKRLIRGLLIRERLKARYDYGAPSQDDAKNKKRKSKGPKVVSKKRRICSESESD